MLEQNILGELYAEKEEIWYLPKRLLLLLVLCRSCSSLWLADCVKQLTGFDGWTWKEGISEGLLMCFPVKKSHCWKHFFITAKKLL